MDSLSDFTFNKAVRVCMGMLAEAVGKVEVGLASGLDIVKPGLHRLVLLPATHTYVTTRRVNAYIIGDMFIRETSWSNRIFI
ncbi:hypothetical protein E6H33_08485 [Candidatus Bathyarchaeota archaeon]|nr:MAG: hypothetical protein E6H33_08485 [Candidatus Bathyarchaeota archaeon]